MTPITMDKWDLRFVRKAQHVASWSKDPSTQVGAVIYKGRRPVSEGFNGLPQKVPDTADLLDDRDTKYKVILHAERNAIIFAAQPLHDCTMYLWPFMPCAACASMIIQAGITRVVAPARHGIARWAADFCLAERLFELAGVKLDLFIFPELESAA